MNDRLSMPLGEKTLWQRVYLTASVFGGLFAAYWAFSHYPETMFSTYAKVNNTYQERLKATRTAIADIKAIEQESGIAVTQATAGLEKDLAAMGEEYRAALKAVPQERSNQAGGAIGAIVLFGLVTAGLICLLGWLVEGIGLQRRIASTKAKTRMHPVHLVSSETARESHQALPPLNPTQQKNP